LKQELLALFLTGRDAGALLPALRSRGILPPGRHGTELFATLMDEVRSFAAVVAAETGNLAPLPPCDLDLLLGDVRLSGRLDGIWPDKKIAWRCAKLKAKDQLRTWIEHLALTVCRPEGYPRDSLLVMTDGTAAFGPVEHADEILQTLLDLYWQGLSRPLRFFPESAMEYAKDLAWNLDRVKNRWDPYLGKGEKDDPYFRLCFGQEHPFTSEFEQIARTVMEPLVRHRN
jgi:exodeoxyribonuclease V gamma subunit